MTNTTDDTKAIDYVFHMKTNVSFHPLDYG